MSYQDLDIEGLRAFATVAETGGFTAAGELLGRTQSAMSVKIKKLEEMLGHRVFARTSRSLSLTPEGEILLVYARRLIDLNDETIQRLSGSETTGSIHLGVAEYVVPEHLPEVLSRFSKVYPQVYVEVKVGTNAALVKSLEKGDLDLVIAKRDESETRGRVIRRERLVWACARDMNLDLGAYIPLCALPAPCVFRSRAMDGLKQMGRAWRVVYTSDSVSGVVAAIRAGLGIAVIAESSLVPELRVLTSKDGFPSLPDVELTVFGENHQKKALKAALVGFIEESLRSLDIRRNLSNRRRQKMSA